MPRLLRSKALVFLWKICNYSVINILNHFARNIWCWWRFFSLLCFGLLRTIFANSLIIFPHWFTFPCCTWVLLYMDVLCMLHIYSLIPLTSSKPFFPSSQSDIPLVNTNWTFVTHFYSPRVTSIMCMCFQGLHHDLYLQHWGPGYWLLALYYLQQPLCCGFLIITSILLPQTKCRRSGHSGVIWNRSVYRKNNKIKKLKIFSVQLCIDTYAYRNYTLVTTFY